MTLLTICQNAVEEVTAFEKPTMIVGSNNATARVLLAAAKREGYILAQRGVWQQLIREATITTANGTASYALPSDFGRVIPLTEWDQTNYWKLFGPSTMITWQTLKSGIITEGVRRWLKIFNDLVYIHPTPTSADTLSYWYITNQWCESSSGTGQTTWAADTDVARLDEEILTMGVKYRFLKNNGLPYEEEYNEYQREADKALVRFGAERLHLDRSVPQTSASGIVNIQEGSFS